MSKSHEIYLLVKTEVSKFRALMTSLGAGIYFGHNTSYLPVSDSFISNRIERCIGVRTDGSNLFVKYQLHRIYFTTFAKISQGVNIKQ